MTARPWARARRAWDTLRGRRPAAPSDVAHDVTSRDPARFERLLDTVRARGVSWLSEESPVAHEIVGDAAAWSTWAVANDARLSADGRLVATGRRPSLVARSPRIDAGWRYLVVRGLAADTGGVPAHASFHVADGTMGRSLRWPLLVDAAPHTYVIDLAGSGWPATAAITAVRFEPIDCTGTVTLGTLALVADLAQLEEGDARWPLARRYVGGVGIECGALQHPLRVPERARVLYVDRLTAAQAREHYPELGEAPLTSPHIVGDIQRLPIGDARADFYIGNHLLEHAEDAIAGLLEMLRVVRPGGVVYVSVPDVGNPLDRHRPVTPLAHHLQDHDGGLERRAEHLAHYREYVDSAHAHMDAGARDALIARFVAQAYSIHFHTFDEEAFRALLAHACRRVKARVVEFVRNPGPDFDEYVAVVRRTG
ncbi:MAG TPA: methyltransferase domain-containing protein [Candidatus Binatia bacterium]|jgi:SAM-dependent methyltransferase|nr:methyltransferase domain-containing protein [Candidatus Binatia bacterium]